jgi:hypothetical protein
MAGYWHCVSHRIPIPQGNQMTACPVVVEAEEMWKMFACSLSQRPPSSAIPCHLSVSILFHTILISEEEKRGKHVPGCG